MSITRTEELLQASLDGKMTPEEEKELATILESDPEAMNVYLDLQSNEALLMDSEFWEEKRDAEPFVKETMHKIISEQDAFVDSVVSSLPAKPKPIRFLWMAAAASVVVLLGLAVLLRAPQAETVATLARAEDGVQVFDSEGGKKTGVELASGDVITCLTDTEAALVYPDGTEITLRGATLTITQSPEGTKHLELGDGYLRASVAKQPTGKPLVVTTGTAIATVVGTVFTLEANEGQSRLAVKEGAVRFRRLSDKQEVLVEIDQVADTNWKDFAPTPSAIAPYKESLPPTQTPFRGEPWPVPGKIEAEHFDLGGQGVAYHSNRDVSFPEYRNEFVEIRGAQGNRRVVAQSGEWFEYSIDAEAGEYVVVLSAAAKQLASVTLSAGDDVIGSFKIAPGATTGRIPSAKFVRGKRIIRLTATGPIELDWIRFEKVK